MTAPSLHDLIVSVDETFPSQSSQTPLTSDQVVRLERISQASAQNLVTLVLGIGAIGDLIAASTEGEVPHSSLVSAGWLINRLAGLATRLHDENISANYRLQHMKREDAGSSAPRNASTRKRGVQDAEGAK